MLDHGLATLSRWLVWCGGVLLVVLVGITCFEVVARAVGQPTAWVNDYTAYGLLASIFLSLPEITRRRGHVAISFLSDNLPGRLHFESIMQVIAAIALFFTVYLAAQIGVDQWRQGIETISATPIPKAWLTGFMCLGLGVSGLEFLMASVTSWADRSVCG